MNRALGAVFVNERCARALRALPGVRLWHVIADEGRHLTVTEGGSLEEARTAVEWSITRRYGSALNVDFELVVIGNDGEICEPCVRARRYTHPVEDTYEDA